MNEKNSVIPLADIGEVAKKATDDLWTYSEATKDANKIAETNGITFPIYGAEDDEQIGTSVDGKPVYAGDGYRVKIEWKDMVHNFDSRNWNTTDLKWDIPQGTWDNLSEHSEIKITNYSSQTIDVSFKVIPAEGFESITYSFDKAANTNDPVGVLRIAAADQGKTGEGEDLNVAQTGVAYLNLHGMPPEAFQGGNTLIGQVTVMIDVFQEEDDSKELKGISLNKHELGFGEIGSSEQLIVFYTPSDTTSNKAISWISSNTSITTVDNNGNVTAVQNGSATITATDASGTFSDHCTVTVNTEKTASPFLFSDFDEENHTVSVAGLVDPSILVSNMVLPKEIKVISKEETDTAGKYSVQENGSGIKYIVTAVAESAFSNNKNLSGSLTIPDSILSINDKAFTSCTNLAGSLIMADSITEIGAVAFSNTPLTGNLNLSKSLISIGDSAFRLCKFTGSLVIPNSVISIGTYAFAFSKFQGELILSNSLKTIDENAFQGTELVGDLKIPESVVSIGENAFTGSKFNGTLEIPNSVTSIGTRAFSQLEITSVKMKNVTNSNPLTSPSQGMFQSCIHLSSVTLCNSITSISIGCFFGCNALESITIPDSVVTIGKEAFCACNALQSIEIPNSVTLIDQTAFSSALRRITIHRPTNSISLAPWGATNATVNWVG